MNPSEYQELARMTRCPHPANLVKKGFLQRVVLFVSGKLNGKEEQDEEHTGTMMIHALIGLQSELGEISSLVENHLAYNEPFEADKMEKEIGDMLWYIAELCDSIEVDLGDVMMTNLEKLRKRYKAQKFTEEEALRSNRRGEDAVC